MVSGIRHLPGIVVACSCMLSLVAAQAQDQRFPLQPADTSSPRATLQSFRESGREIYDTIVADRFSRGSDATRNRVQPDIERLFGCLDLSQEPAYLRESAAAEASVCLLEVLDRIELPPENEIPGPDEVSGEDGIAKWRIPETPIVIYRVAEGPQSGEYLFSPETVADASSFYERVQHLPYRDDQALKGFYDWFLSEPGVPWLAAVIDWLPAWTRQRVYGQAIWQWLGLLATVVLGVAAMLLIYRIGRRRSQRLRSVGALRNLTTMGYSLAALVVPLIVRHVATDYLVISGTTLIVVEFATSVVLLLGALVVIVAVGNRVAELIIASPRVQPGGIDAQFIRIGCRALSLVLAVIVFLEGGQHLGIPLTTLLAGAGVGGLTVALAAQDTLRNLFGSMMIMLDKPFRVGERIVAKGYDGVVQEVGLRSTRLRLLTGHEVTIPNDDMARSDIENIGRRPHIRRHSNIAIPLGLPPEKAEQAVTIVREILKDHEGMDPAYPPRVFLNEFNRDSLNICLFYWYHPPNYWDYLAFCEKVNLRIKCDFDHAGIPFALPSSATIMSQSPEQPLQVEVLPERHPTDELESS